MTHSANAKQQMERCLERLRAGQLTEDDLRAAIHALERNGTGRQDLLYLQCSGTSVASPVVGMALVRDGKIVDDERPENQWPYANVLEAIRDGWRVVQFPNLALMLDERRTYGLGCEFILEKWRPQ